MCDSSASCTDGSSYPVTPQTDGPHPVHVVIASKNSQLRDRISEVKASGNSRVRKAPAVMPSDCDQIAKEFVDLIVKEFEEQTATDDMISKLLGQLETFKLIENPPQIPQGHKFGASSLHCEEHLPKMFV